MMKYRTSLVSPSAMRQVHDQINSLRTIDSGAMRQIHDQINSLQTIDSGAMRQIHDQINSLRTIDSGAMRQIHDQINSLRTIDSGAMRQIHDQINSLRTIDSGAMRQIHDQINSLRTIDSGAMRQIHDQINSLRTIDSGAMRQIHDQINSLRTILSDISFNESTMTVNGKEVDTLEFESVVSDLAESSTNAIDFFDRLMIWIDTRLITIEDNLRVFICTVLLPYLLSTWVPIHFNPWSDEERRRLVKEISQEIKEAHSADDIREYRYVTAKRGLLIRAASNKKSQAIGGLLFASVVKLINISDNRDWSFIEDEHGNQGWVYSRYLNHFR